MKDSKRHDNKCMSTSEAGYYLSEEAGGQADGSVNNTAHQESVEE